MDTRFQPRADLLQYIEGKPWTVDYFQVVVGPDDELSQQQTDVAAPFQQYKCIHGYRLLVTQALNQGTSQDETSKSMIVEGAANLHPGLIPNHGDVFLGDIGDGREGLFRVTGSTKKTHLRETCYEIQYSLIGYADTANRYIEDLKRKTIQDLWWHQDYYTYGSDPKLTTEEYNEVISLDRIFEESVDQFMVEFFSVDKQTLLVPGQETQTYDPFLTRFIQRLITTEDNPYIGRVRTPSVDQHLVTRYPTVLDSMLDRNIRLLKINTQQARLVQTGYFRSMAQLSGIYYTGIERVVFPFRMDHVRNSYYENCPTLMADALIRAGKPAFNSLDRLFSATQVDGLYWKHVTEHPTPIGVNTLQDIVPVTVDDYYIFTGHFYRNQVPTSKLEHIVLQHLKQETLDRDILLDLAKKSIDWNPVERFYYVPVLWALIISSLRSR